MHCNLKTFHTRPVRGSKLRRFVDVPSQGPLRGGPVESLIIGDTAMKAYLWQNSLVQRLIYIIQWCELIFSGRGDQEECSKSLC